MSTSVGIVIAVLVLAAIAVLLKMKAWRPLFFVLGLVVFGLFWGQVVKDQIHPYDAYQQEYRQRLVELAGGDPAKVDFKPGIVQRYIPALNRSDRCETCHLAVDNPRFKDAKQPFTTHPNISTHPPDRFGCTVCHEGVGISVDLRGAHGHQENWRNPVLDKRLVQSRCVQCHERGAALTGSSLYAQGEILFNRVGCLGCHPVKGQELERLPGPDLRILPNKMQLDWLAGWLKDPNSYLKKSYMPNFELSDDDVKAITSYLVASARGYLADQGVPSLGRDVPTDPTKVAEGKQLVLSVGCLGCHNIDDAVLVDEAGLDPTVRERNFGPDLARTGDKLHGQWIKEWVLNPQGQDPKTTMPNMRLSPKEAEAIAAYLQQKGDSTVAKIDLAAEPDNAELVARGKQRIEWFNCSGCHPIAGFEGRAFYGPELTFEGDLDYFRLAFDLKKEEMVERDEKEKVQSHLHVANFVRMKLEDARQFRPELLKMPNFHFSPEEVEALTVYVTSLKARVYPASFHVEMDDRRKAISRGREMFARYNCRGCHELDPAAPRSSGHLRAYYAGEAKALAPPVLHGEGRKVQPLWVQGFMQRPITLRPWLAVRMPTFGLSDGEAETLSAYFIALEESQHPFYGVDSGNLDPVSVAEGKELLMRFKCLKCHVLGAEIPKDKAPNELAPNLELTKSRLRPAWIDEWLTDPQGFQAGTRMPNFFFFDEIEDENGEAVLDAAGNPKLDYTNDTAKDNLAQIHKMRDYLMTLDAAEARQMWSRLGSGGDAAQ
ncbi:MAG: hypothetical protein COZ96_08625 [Nitrospirae bacterium CG_4_8_14_3_um_filter_70_85]|nr:c-type cytochrome [Deltaproteobacteria bacterium]NCP96431.1 c-type cytochrome [Deltaproteobacteria bacterium]PIW82433.1 MAG: hypothetical protein COZ96_08625 [Nitrospirae bacterium CG_4_8_14_3_um_filter_70_85]HBB40523.1 hypothetical protein [Pseudomonadota bacterium]